MTVPLMMGHRIMGMSLLGAGDIAESRTHLDRTLALYNPAEHRPLGTRFGQDIGVMILSFRSWARWLLGYPDTALADTNNALKDARGTGQAATLMFALLNGSFTHVLCGNYAAANAEADELAALADEKGALLWKAFGMSMQGCLLALTVKASDAVHMITSGITALRSTGGTLWMPLWLSPFDENLCGTPPIQ
jgi:hypothetical protein